MAYDSAGQNALRIVGSTDGEQTWPRITLGRQDCLSLKKKKYTKKQNKKPFAALKGSKTARKALRQKVRVKVTRQDQTVVMTLMQQCQELESKAIHPWTKSSYSFLKSYQK